MWAKRSLEILILRRFSMRNSRLTRSIESMFRPVRRSAERSNWWTRVTGFDFHQFPQSSYEFFAIHC